MSAAGNRPDISEKKYSDVDLGFDGMLILFVRCMFADDSLKAAGRESNKIWKSMCDKIITYGYETKKLGCLLLLLLL